MPRMTYDLTVGVAAAPVEVSATPAPSSDGALATETGVDSVALPLGTAGTVGPETTAGRALANALRHSAKAHMLGAWAGTGEVRATLAAGRRSNGSVSSEQWSVFASRDIAAGEVVLAEEALGTGRCPDTHPMSAVAGKQTLAMMELARSLVLDHSLDTLAARLAPATHLDPLRQAIGSGGKEISIDIVAGDSDGLGKMFSDKVATALTKHPARLELVCALLHPLALDTALQLLLEATMRNAHLVHDPITSMAKGATAGIGVSSSLLNHSCVPSCKVSCIASTDGAMVTVQAVKALARDEELTIAYIGLNQDLEEDVDSDEEAEV